MMIDNHHQQSHQIVPRSTTGGGGPVETSGIGASRSQQFSTATTTNPGDNGKPDSDLAEKSVSSQYERLPLSSEKKKPEVKTKPKLPKVIPVVKKVGKKS